MNVRRLRPITPGMERRLDLLRSWSTQLDSRFQVPGTGIRFGWDPIIGLIPGIGDLITPLFSLATVVTAVQLDVPRVVQVRMAMNVLIDAAIGFVPFLGDLFDVAWKSNLMNMRLLEEHAYEERDPRPGDWIFVIGIALILLAAAVTPIVLLMLLLDWAGRSWV
jgi:hypothetical protein